MLVSVLISLNELVEEVDVIVSHVMSRGKLHLGHLNMDNPPLRVRLC